MTDHQGTNRERILHHALLLLTERGFNGVGVEELATAAGITKPTLYHYFGSKLGVLETLLLERYDPYLEMLAEAAVYHRRDLTRSLTAVVWTCFDFGMREPSLFRMVLAAGLTARDDAATRIMAERIDTQDRILRRLFAEAGQDHGNMAGRHHLAAASLQATIVAHLQLAAAGEMTLDDGAVWQLIQQFSYGIYT